MGVKTCDRNSCDGGMCNNLVDGRYYLCDKCLEEFKAVMRTWPYVLLRFPMTDIPILTDQFMTTVPGTFIVIKDSVARFDEDTKNLIVVAERRMRAEGLQLCKCGGTPSICQDKYHYYARCQGCGKCTVQAATSEQAAYFWNTTP